MKYKLINRSLKSKGVRCALIFTLIMVLVFANSCSFCVAIIMSRGSVQRLEKIKIKHYKITLTRRQGWAGPACYVYELRREILFSPLYVKIAKKQVWCNTDTICTLDFEKRSKKIVRVNLCGDNVRRQQKKIRSY